MAPSLKDDMEADMSDEKVTTKAEGRPVMKAVSKAPSAVKTPDPIDLDLKAIGNEASLIKASNISVILRIGNEGVYREVQMKNLAREIKARA